MKFTLLDHGYLRYVEHWGLGDAGIDEAGIIEAARMSTNKAFQGWDQDEKLLAYLYKHKHSTPFEFAGMTIEIHAPIAVFREWHRHRTQSYGEMSARYIPLPNENYLPEIENLLNRAHEAATSKNRQATGTGKILSRERALIGLDKLFQYYQLGQELYTELLNDGWPKELARLPIPVARYSRMRASGNLRNWLAFLTLRLDPNAQWEIRQYANACGKVIETNFPRTWRLFCE